MHHTQGGSLRLCNQWSVSFLRFTRGPRECCKYTRKHLTDPPFGLMKEDNQHHFRQPDIGLFVSHD